MTRQKFVEQYLNQSMASTQATRRATAQDKRNATGTTAIDYRVDRSTEKE